TRCRPSISPERSSPTRGSTSPRRSSARSRHSSVTRASSSRRGSGFASSCATRPRLRAAPPASRMPRRSAGWRWHAGRERPAGGSARLGAMSLREWTVAGGLIETDSGVLLVRNQRRGGFEDWSTPGGVIDAEDSDLLAGLSREVFEETGLIVREWLGPLYEVRA